MIESNIDKTLWSAFLKKTEKFEVPAKTILLEEGKISKKAYFIEKGCARLWVNNNGNDVTFQFFFEKEAVASLESFIFKKPSMYYIETLEPCVIYSITKEDFDVVVADSVVIKEKINDLLYSRLLHFQKLFLNAITNNPKERYDKLLAKHPSILNRIPQHYIASYLGVTSVSLSRIRNRK